MARLITYTVLRIKDSLQLHQLHTSNGKFFVMGEVAQLFDETPNSVLQELRKGKYNKTNSSSPEVLQTICQLGLQVEGAASHAGVVLLPPETVEQLLLDKRRLELLQPLRLAMLKLASQEAARLMAAGDYEAALPVSLEAVKLGEQLFKPQPALQLFPLYLLAAQANLGLRRALQCEKCLALASMLALKEPANTTHVMRSQLSRLQGQLYAFQNKAGEALQAFAEDVFHCSLEFGPQDARTSLGYYNLFKVLQSMGAQEQALACSDMVVAIWSACLQRCVLRVQADGAQLAGPPDALPVGRLQLVEVVEMLLDICTLRAATFGADDPRVAAAHTVAGVALTELGQSARAAEQLHKARAVLQSPAAAAGRQDAGSHQEQQLLLLLQQAEAHARIADGVAAMA